MDAPVDMAPPLTLDAPPLEDIERRLHSLEDAVARLEDTHALEERVLARVTTQLPQSKAPPPADTGILEERILAKLAERLPPPAPSANGRVSDPPNFVELPYPATLGGGWTAWLLLDMFDEAKTLIRMLRDRRYHMAWSTRLVVLVFAPTILFTHWWFPLAWVPGLGGFLVNIVNFALAFVVYRALGRETRRYREAVSR